MTDDAPSPATRMLDAAKAHLEANLRPIEARIAAAAGAATGDTALVPVTTREAEVLAAMGVRIVTRARPQDRASLEAMKRLRAMTEAEQGMKLNESAQAPSNAEIAAEIARIADQLPPDKLAAAIEAYLHEVR